MSYIQQALVALAIGLALIFVCVLAGCDEQSIPRTESEPNPNRFNVEYCGSFEAAAADRAYRRSIYVVVDKQTGVKYLAIEGCGTAQLVQEGKTIQEQ